MHLLRNDLIIVPSNDNGETACQIRDPVSGEIFEFGEPEYFLIKALAHPYVIPDLLAKFNAKFGFETNTDEFYEFLSMLSNWGLLKKDAILKPPLRSTKPHQIPSPQGEKPMDNSATEKNESKKNPEYSEEKLDDVIFEDIIDQEPDLLLVETKFDPHANARKKNEQAKSPISNHFRFFWNLFCPEKLLDILWYPFYPLKYLAYILPIMCFISLFILLENLHYLEKDLTKLIQSVNLFYHILFTLFTINLTSQIGRGIICRNYNVEVPNFGIKLALGLLPRFEIFIGDIQTLPKVARLWIQASQLIIRLALFCTGAAVWLVGRPTGTGFSTYGLTLATFALFEVLLFFGNPLIKSSAYDVLTTYLEIPGLREKANRALFSIFSKRDRLFRRDEQNRLALQFYALACFIYLIGLAGLALILLAKVLEAQYGGTGVLIFLIIFAYLIYFYHDLIKSKLAAKSAHVVAGITGARGGGQANFIRNLIGIEGDGGDEALLHSRQLPRAAMRMRRQAMTPEKPITPRTRPWLRYLLLAIFVACLFLPYPYETGGPATVLSLQKYQIFAETAGIIEQVLCKTGEWINKDEVIAKLASYIQVKDYYGTLAAIKEQQAQIDKMLSTPTKEELDVAKQQLASAKTKAKYSVTNLQRKETLYKSGNISLDQYEDAKRQKDVDEMDALEKEANLALVQAGVHPKQIEAAKAELERLEVELKDYDEQLKRTNLRMPVDGRIVTMNVDLLAGKYLDKGDLFAEAENDKQVRVEVEIPESDIGEIDLGHASRLKIWTYPNRIFYGTVSEIAPTTTSEEYGKVLKVVSVIPNENGLLKSGTTGFAKIDGGTKPVIVAFTRMLVRFVMIEIWSWIP